MSESVELDIADILRLKAWQVRSKLDSAAVNRYAGAYASGADMPPIEVAKIDRGGPSVALVLIDGWHRVAALEQLGRSTVEAIVTEASEGDARWRAAKANLSHGVPLKPREYRAVFRAYITAGQHKRGARRMKSYREIAADLGGAVSFSCVRNWMQKDYPRIAKAMGGPDDHGGNREAPRSDPEGAMVAEAVRGVATVVSVAEALRDPKRRGELVEALEVALKRLMDRRPYTRPDHNDDF